MSLPSIIARTIATDLALLGICSFIVLNMERSPYKWWEYAVVYGFYVTLVAFPVLIIAAIWLV